MGLVAPGGAADTHRTTLVLVANDGTDLIDRTFADLPEVAVLESGQLPGG